MPTIKDVAREAGVSIATVSYVINNKTYFVSEGTRRQVLAAIERIGYTPNVTARNLQASQTLLIGYAWHEVPKNQMMNPVMDAFTYYLAQAVERAGYHLLTFTHPPSQPLPIYSEIMRAGRVDAFVLAGTRGNDSRIRFLMDQRMPFVSFGRSNPEWDFDWVDADGRQAVYDAVRYLIDLGHRRIAMVAWPEESISGSFRVAGYIDALREAGLAFRPEYLLRGNNSEHTGRAALAQWCNLPADQQPTSVVAVSDLMAIGVMQEAEQRGIAVGKQLSVVGFDDSPIGQYTRPTLTTLHQPLEEISQALVRVLEGKLSYRETEKQHVLVPCRLIVRESSGPPLR